MLPVCRLAVKCSRQPCRCLSSIVHLSNTNHGHDSGGGFKFGRLDRITIASGTAAIALSVFMTFRRRIVSAEACDCDRNSTDYLPKHVPYLIIGGGPAAFSAMQSIRGQDPRAKVLIVTADKRLPYMKTPLSKELWFNQTAWFRTKVVERPDDPGAPPNLPEVERVDVEPSQSAAEDRDVDISFVQWSGRRRSISFEPAAFFIDLADLTESEDGGISVVTGHTVAALNIDGRVATLDDGSTVSFDKCLVATGSSSPVESMAANHFDSLIKCQVSTLNSVSDYIRLRRRLTDLRRTKMAAKPVTVAIVGDDITAVEIISAVLHHTGDEEKQPDLSDVNIVHLRSSRSWASDLLPATLATYIESLVTARHPDRLTLVDNFSLDSASRVSNLNTVRLVGKDGRHFDVDHVIYVPGKVMPNANITGLKPIVDGAYEADDQLQVAPNIWVAGDVCRVKSLAEYPTRSHSRAVDMGKLAGLNMASKVQQKYTSRPMFWSDLTQEISVEGVGLLDANRLSTTTYLTKEPEFDEDMRGVVFYRDQSGAVVGILVVNIFNRLDLARHIMDHAATASDDELVKLFDLHRQRPPPKPKAESAPTEADVKVHNSTS